MENDFLYTLNTGSFFLGMSDFLTEGHWLWGSDGSEVTWKNWVTWPVSALEPPSERNCAVMTIDLRTVGNDADQIADRKGWVDVGCKSDDRKSLICQRGKAG